MGRPKGRDTHSPTLSGRPISRVFPFIIIELMTDISTVSVLSVLFGHSHLTHRTFIFVDLAIIDII